MNTIRLKQLACLLAFALTLLAYAAHAQTGVVFTNLYNFGSYPLDGELPDAALVQGSDGYFYGTTSSGGTNGYGTVFKISTNGALSILYSFGGKYGDGYNPGTGLIQGSDGYFYGTTSTGGTNGHGTVFKISGSGALATLYSFSGNDGDSPNTLVQASDGYLYGTTQGGGANGSYYGGYFYGYGTVFKISTSGALTSLYSFGSITNSNGNPLDGAGPWGGLVQASDGYLYGTTSGGGTNGYDNVNSGWGTVFKISTGGALASLYSFGSITNSNGDPLDGADPVEWGRLMQGSDGYLYGTTSGGGTNGAGTVFKISTNGALTRLYSFGSITNANTPAADGTTPYAGLVLGSDGYFYGTTAFGGTNGNGGGTVFKISSSGALTTLYNFSGGNDGKGVYPGLVQGSDGNFYGTTTWGGTGTYSQGYNGPGTVFRLTVVPSVAYLQGQWLNQQLVLSWTNAGFSLQAAPAVTGTFTNLPGATSPYTNPVTGTQQFFRLMQ